MELHEFTYEPDSEPARLDQVVARLTGGITRAAAQRLIETGMVTVLMGKATFVDDFLYDNVMFIGVEIGNPHAITLEALSEEPFVHISEHLQKDPRFSGINVSMMRATDHHNLYVKTYERGVGLTPACGSAATACAFLAMEKNLVIAPITVHMPGGEVTVDWQDNQLTLTGPAVRVYTGVWYYP